MSKSDSQRPSSKHSLFPPPGKASDNQRFVFVEKELSWPDAQLYCRKFHTDLASVRNKEENQEMQLLAQNRATWIGLYRSAKLDIFFCWLDGYVIGPMRAKPLLSHFILPVFLIYNLQSLMMIQNTAESCRVESLETTQGPLSSFFLAGSAE